MPDMYPGTSLDKQVGGRAKIVCREEPRQGLEDCQVISELPVGMGFGAAGLKKVRAGWAMRPRRIGGELQSDGRLLFNVGFPPPQRSSVHS